MTEINYKTLQLGVAFFLAFTSSTFAIGQEIPNDFGYQDYKKVYPKETVVFKNIKIVDVFDIKSGELYITSETEEEIVYLDKHVQGYAERTVWYDGFSEILALKATCYYPEKGKFKKETVKDFEDQEVITGGMSFHDDTKKRLFRYNKIREGSRTLLTYKKLIKDPHLLYGRTFTRGVFIQNEIYTMKVHKDIDLGFIEYNMEGAPVKFSESLDGNYKIYKWEKLNAKKENIYGDDSYSQYHEPQVIPYVKTYTINGKEEVIFRNLDDLYAWYAELVSRVKPVENENIAKLADSLTQGAKTDLEKVKRIYYWVQDNVKYIAFGDGYGGFVPRDPDKIYERRFGDCKDMSCLTINLLDAVDIKAYFTWVGTRSIPYVYSEVFTPQVDNHMIATYKDENGKNYYLDATDPNLDFGRPSYAIQEKEVLIGINENEYELTMIPALDGNKTVESDSVYFTIEGDKIIGTGSMWFSGYIAEEVIADFEDKTEEEILKTVKNSLEKGSNKYIPSNLVHIRPNNSKDSINLTYDFEVDDYVNQVGESIYINLNLTKQHKYYDIDEKQNVPVILDYKNKLYKNFYLTIPEGYGVDYIPENTSVESEFISYKIDYTIEGNIIHYHYFLDMPALRLNVDDFEAWNSVIKKLSKDFDESIKLIKK